jgi:ATP-dependent Zn protease
MPIKKETQYHTWYWIAAIAAVMVIQGIFASLTQIQTIPYSEFQDDLKAGKIAEVRVSGNYIQGKFKEPDPKSYTEFITTRVRPSARAEKAKRRYMDHQTPKNSPIGISHDNRSRRKVLSIAPANLTLYFESSSAVGASISRIAS